MTLKQAKNSLGGGKKLQAGRWTSQPALDQSRYIAPSAGIAEKRLSERGLQKKHATVDEQPKKFDGIEGTKSTMALGITIRSSSVSLNSPQLDDGQKLGY